MAHRALIEVLGDAESYLRSLRASNVATTRFEGDLKGLAISARTSADAQVAASVHKTARLRQEVVAYHEIAAAASRGSREQVAAANLASRAEYQLSRSLGVTARESRSLAASSGRVERDIGRATRGALAGSGVFRTFGRSLAFASGGAFVRKSIDVAREATVTQKQLATQLKDDGRSFADYRDQIDKTGLRISALSGFTKDDLDQALTTILRSTTNVGKALRDEGTAADLARAKHIGLSQSALILGKVEAGNTTLLRRQGFEIAKHISAQEALAIVRAKVAGQAKAGSTEQERFGAVLHDSEVIIGAGLLPTLNQYLASGAEWLTQMNESGRLQKDVKHITKDVTRVLHDAGEVAHFFADGVRAINRVTGSTEQTLKDFAAVWLLIKSRTVIRWIATQTGILMTGRAAATATGEVAGLRAALLRLNGLAIVATVVVLERKQIAKGLFHIPGAEDFAKFVDDRVPFLKALDKKAGVYPGQLDPKRYGPHAPDGYVPGSYGKRQSTPQNPGGYIAKSTVAPKGYQPGTYGMGMSTPENPGGFLPIVSTRTPAPARSRGPRPVSLTGRFNLDELRLADAQRTQNTKLQRAILVDEETIVLKLRDQAKTLKDRTKYAQQAAGIESSITSIDQQAAAKRADAAAKRKAAADKAKAAAEKAALGGVPLRLQLDQARADALAAATGSTDLTKGQLAAAHAIRNAEMRAIRSHRLSMQGLIDAWTVIGGINQQLSSQTSKWATDTYHIVSSRALTDGLGLSRKQRLLVEEREAQSRAHRRHAPSGPAAQGQVVHEVIVTTHDTDRLIAKIEKKTRVRNAQR